MIYSPAEDSYLIEKEVKKFAKGRKVLDMGTGSGILANAAVFAGAKSVIAADISNEAVKRLKLLGIKAIKSDLFDKIKDKFDLIIFNPPYLPDDKNEDKESKLITTGGKKGDEVILRFLRQAPKHLSPDGLILLLLSSLTPRENISLLLKKMKLHSVKISHEDLFFESLEVFKIQKA